MAKFEKPNKGKETENQKALREAKELQERQDAEIARMQAQQRQIKEDLAKVAGPSAAPKQETSQPEVIPDTLEVLKEVLNTNKISKDTSDAPVITFGLGEKEGEEARKIEESTKIVQGLKDGDIVMLDGGGKGTIQRKVGETRFDEVEFEITWEDGTRSTRPEEEIIEFFADGVLRLLTEADMKKEDPPTEEKAPELNFDEIIENAQKILAENRKLAEEIRARLAELDAEENEETPEDIQKKIDELETEIINISNEIRGKRTELAWKILGRGELKKEIKDFQKVQQVKQEKRNQLKEKKEEREREKLEKDRKERPFLYFVAEKNKNPYIYEFEKGPNADLTWATWMTSPENYGAQNKSLYMVGDNEGYFDLNIYGFVMIIKNVAEIKQEDGINSWSEKAIYKIVGPAGEIVADNIQGYYPAKKAFDSATSEYRAKVEKEFEDLNK